MKKKKKEKKRQPIALNNRQDYQGRNAAVPHGLKPDLGISWAVAHVSPGWPTSAHVNLPVQPA